jgi:hypothetical protein
MTKILEAAAVESVESELVVRGGPSCQNLPAAVEEMRRILHQDLNQFDSEPDGNQKTNEHQL